MIRNFFCREWEDKQQHGRKLRRTLSLTSGLAKEKGTRCFASKRRTKRPSLIVERNQNISTSWLVFSLSHIIKGFVPFCVCHLSQKFHSSFELFLFSCLSVSCVVATTVVLKWKENLTRKEQFFTHKWKNWLLEKLKRLVIYPCWTENGWRSGDQESW